MEEKEKKELNLYQKINLIQNAGMEISKNGKNKFAKYTYKTFTDIKRAVMDKMRELGVVFLPAMIQQIPVWNDKLEIGGKDLMNLFTEKLINKKGNENYMVKYIQCFELINADKPEERQRFLFPMVGSNTDGFDKANGSATTYSLKYLFNLWGLIPDETLDPDDTEQTEKRSQGSKTGHIQAKDDITEQVVLEAIKNKSIRDEMANQQDLVMNTLMVTKPKIVNSEYLKENFTKDNLNKSAELYKKIKGERK